MNDHHSWIAGEHHGLIWAHGLALVDGGIPLEAAGRLWLRLRDTCVLADFVQALSEETGQSWLTLPDFAVALSGAGGWLLAARGSFEAVAGEGGPISGAGLTTWAERAGTGTVGLEVGTAGATGGPARTIVAGVVPASRLRWAGARVAADSVCGSERRDGPLPGPLSSTMEDGGVPVAVAPPRAEDGASRAEAENPRIGGGSPRAEADMPPVEEGASAVAVSDGQVAPPGEALSPAEVALPERRDAETRVEELEPRTGSGEAAGRFAQLWGETRMVSVEDAALRAAAGEPSELNEPAPTAEPLAVPVSTVGDHDGLTQFAAAASPGEVTAARASLGEPDTASGELVLAADCAAGHPNPPQRSTCSLCGAPVLGEPRRVRRPALGTLRLPSGERVDLDTPILAGRNPRSDRVEGPTLPRLVALPHGHVSGNHVEFRLAEWSVLAVDLRSRNGTFLRRRGQEPVRLGERPELLIEGDVLDLGHGVQFTLEKLR